jgi:hypothetical protein
MYPLRTFYHQQEMAGATSADPNLTGHVIPSDPDQTGHMISLTNQRILFYPFQHIEWVGIIRMF